METILNEYLRHTLSTIAYRFQKSVNTADVGFGGFFAGSGTRTPNQIIRHMYRVLNSARVFVRDGRFDNIMPEKLSLKSEIDRFNLELIEMDRLLSGKELDMEFSKKILQGPFSDILTHVGQLSMLRRLCGGPIPGEDFSAAPIKTGILTYVEDKLSSPGEK